MSTHTIRLHRVLRTPPERVYRAFLDADAKAKWLPPYGFTCKVHHLDAKVGGTYKMSFTSFATGQGHSFGGRYVELVPSERIVYTGLPGTWPELLAGLPAHRRARVRGARRKLHAAHATGFPRPVPGISRQPCHARGPGPVRERRPFFRSVSVNH